MKQNIYGAIIFTAIVLIIGISLFARPYRISGDCMEPAVKDGQLCFLNRISPYLRHYKIGDIVLFKHDEKIWISRIVALENDTIQITDGSVSVNGVSDKVHRSWAHWEHGTHAINKPLKIPTNHVFVLSDNLAAQHDDSRVFGPVPQNAILGLIW